MGCKCGNEKCKGFLLVHSEEMKNLRDIKGKVFNEMPEVSHTELMESPSSGEMFTKFYELHLHVK